MTETKPDWITVAQRLVAGSQHVPIGLVVSTETNKRLLSEAVLKTATRVETIMGMPYRVDPTMRPDCFGVEMRCRTCDGRGVLRFSPWPCQHCVGGVTLELRNVVTGNLEPDMALLALADHHMPKEISRSPCQQDVPDAGPDLWNELSHIRDAIFIRDDGMLDSYLEHIDRLLLARPAASPVALSESPTLSEEERNAIRRAANGLASDSKGFEMGLCNASEAASMGKDASVLYALLDRLTTPENENDCFSGIDTVSQSTE